MNGHYQHLYCRSFYCSIDGYYRYVYGVFELLLLQFLEVIVCRKIMRFDDDSRMFAAADDDDDSIITECNRLI